MTQSPPVRRGSFTFFAGVSAILAAIVMVVYRHGLSWQLETQGIEDVALAHVAAYEAGTGWVSQISHWSIGVSSLLLLALVLAIARLMTLSDRGWVLWATGAGIIAFALNGYENVYAALVEPVLVSTYLDGDETVQAAVVANWLHVYLDPGGLIYGTSLVIWLLSVNYLAWRYRYWHRRLAGFGLAIAALIVLVEVASVLILPGIVHIVLSEIVHWGFLPVWYALMGLALLGVISKHASEDAVLVARDDTG